jgi:CRP/FNR family transcriptional regulator, dissimilatory nitrate respiration regulator
LGKIREALFFLRVDAWVEMKTPPPADASTATILAALRRSRLFADASPTESLQIASISLLKAVRKDEYLFYENTPLPGFYIVETGAIKVRRISSTGVEQVLHVFRPSESFGEEMLFIESGYPADACALEGSRVILVRRQEFISLLRRNPEMALRVLRSMDGHLRNLVGLLDDLMLKDVKTRLVNWLLQHCPDPQSREPYTIHLQSTKRMLASELGTVSETFSRTLAKFRKEKLLSVDRDAITLTSPLRLWQWVHSRA